MPSRECTGTDDAPAEKITIAGITGNVYTQHITHMPCCDCPPAKHGMQCEHLVYIMMRVLKAREELAMQLTLTSAELREVFSKAAPLPTRDSSGAGDSYDGYTDEYRKKIEGECSVCYCEFGCRSLEDVGNERIVFCRNPEGACGNNVHLSCMRAWATTKGPGKVTCPE